MGDPGASNPATGGAPAGVGPLPRRWPWLFPLACLLLGLLKLWLVHGQEIIARNIANDDVWCLEMARHWYWGQGHPTEPFVRPPAFPLWVALVNLTGVPLRLATEVLYLTAAAVFAGALVRARLPRGLDLLVFVGMAFQPASLVVNDYAIWDTLFTPTLWLTLAGLVLLWQRSADHPGLGLAMATGAAAAVTWLARDEWFLNLLYLVGAAVITAAWFRYREGLWRRACRRTAITLGLPAAVVLAVVLSVQTANRIRFGVFATSGLNAPGFQAACKALLRIRPAQEPGFRILVPREARERAYAVSPTFREIRPYLEGRGGVSLAGESQWWTDAEHDEYRGEWVYWALRGSVARAGHHRSAAESEAFYQRMANEINAALTDGRLPARPVLINFLDPSFRHYAPRLIPSLQLVLDRFTLTQWPRSQEERWATPLTRELFDQVANRRLTLTREPAVELSGWVYHPHDPVRTVVVRAPGGETLASTDRLLPRPDIVVLMGKGGNQVGDTGFNIRTPLDSTRTLRGELVFTTAAGLEFHVPFDPATVSNVIEVAGPTGAAPLTYAIDDATPNVPSFAVEKSLQDSLWEWHGKAVALLGWASLVALAVLVACRRRWGRVAGAFPVVALLAMALAGRVALFTVIDAAVWTAAGDLRYFLPILPLFTAIALTLIWAAGRVLIVERSA